MKTAVLAVSLAAILGAPALAQTTTTPEAGQTAIAPAPPMAGGPFYTVEAPAEGQMAMSHLASDLDDFAVYGANNERIGEIDDLVVNSDGRVAAAVIEVGGFLGVGRKNVLVNFDALQMRMEGDEMRVVAEGLTRDALNSAPNTNLDEAFPDHD